MGFPWGVLDSLTLCTVEVAPIYDNPGETTALAAAEVVHSLIALMVETPVKGKVTAAPEF